MSDPERSLGRSFMRCRLLLGPAVLSALSCADAADPAAPPPEPAVTVTPAADTLVIGHALRLRATVTGAGARVTWTSSDASVAAVDASGLVTGVADGTATITASSGTVQGSAEIRVATADWVTLATFYHATDGPNWTLGYLWLTEAPLDSWRGVTTDEHGRVVQLALRGNGLTGFIPPELGNLAALESISLTGNRLSGPLPPELGRLANLRNLVLWNNELTGTIPRELANLPELRFLTLSGNNLTGSIPPELGRLTHLRGLSLESNELSGPVPPEIGELANLTHLAVTHNAGMSGPLPSTFENLRQVRALLAGGTGVCAPADPGFQAWLETVPKRRIASCADAVEPMASLTQAVQSHAYPVPLVAGRRALLRVFVLATSRTTAVIPPIRARFFIDGREVYVGDIPAGSRPIPTELQQRNLSLSGNLEVPGSAVQPGLEVVIEVDPDRTLASGILRTNRIPAAGRMTIDVREVPPMDITLIPFLWTGSTDTTIVDIVHAMAADPEGHELLGDTRMMLPISELAVTAHAPVRTSNTKSRELLQKTEAIRTIEGGAGYYLGMIDDIDGGAGRGYISGRSSIAEPIASTIAHEFGHNFSLYHAPCGGAGGTDPSYPHPDGIIGAWGYDFRINAVVSRLALDFMSYCEFDWASDYHFTNALRFRIYDEERRTGASGDALFVWGGVNADGEPYLDPAFVVEAPPSLPESPGDHRVTARTADGDVLFSFSFAMPDVADGDGSSSFAFAIPAQANWAGNLASVTLTGPGGIATLDRGTNRPMAILRDQRTGRIRGILDVSAAALGRPDLAAALSGEPGLEVLISRGLPATSEWRR